MSDDLVNALLRRMDRVETLTDAHYSPPDRLTEIEALRKELTGLKENLRIRDAEMRDMRHMLANKTDAATVAAIVSKHITPHVEVIGDFVGDAVVQAERTLRTEIEDSNRALTRTVEKAEASTAGPRRTAVEIINQYAAAIGG
jgi:hypothetical protein